METQKHHHIAAKLDATSGVRRWRGFSFSHRSKGDEYRNGDFAVQMTIFHLSNTIIQPPPRHNPTPKANISHPKQLCFKQSIHCKLYGTMLWHGTEKCTAIHSAIWKLVCDDTPVSKYEIYSEAPSGCHSIWLISEGSLVYNIKISRGKYFSQGTILFDIKNPCI